ncbi:MAG: hypothetical protein P1U58_01095 [Verrucomicrobiales bacterium]|nr:hypothetical protein [Verrucomicrobiales bacterium]
MEKKFWKIAVLIISVLAIVSLYFWATPERTMIADGYELIHFRGNGGMTYVINGGGIKLAGPVIKNLTIDEKQISGLGGPKGETPFSIDRQSGEVTHSELITP